MNDSEKLAAAVECVNLSENFDVPSRAYIPQDALQNIDERRKLTIELKAELYAKYYSEEQLAAMLQFYKSEIGTAILALRPTIAHELDRLSQERGFGGWEFFYPEATEAKQ